MPDRRPDSPGTPEARPGAGDPREIDLACQSLHTIRDHLVQLSRLGGGDVTPGLLQAAVDDSPDAVLVTNREAEIVMVNGVVARLLGISTRQLQTMTIWDITHASSQADFDVLWREFRRAGRQRGVYAMRGGSGEPVMVAYCAQTELLPDKHILVLRNLAQK